MLFIPLPSLPYRLCASRPPLATALSPLRTSRLAPGTPDARILAGVSQPRQQPYDFTPPLPSPPPPPGPSRQPRWTGANGKPPDGWAASYSSRKQGRATARERKGGAKRPPSPASTRGRADASRRHDGWAAMGPWPVDGKPARTLRQPRGRAARHVRRGLPAARRAPSADATPSLDICLRGPRIL